MVLVIRYATSCFVWIRRVKHYAILSLRLPERGLQTHFLLWLGTLWWRTLSWYAFGSACTLFCMLVTDQRLVSSLDFSALSFACYHFQIMIIQDISVLSMKYSRRPKISMTRLFRSWSQGSGNKSVVLFLDAGALASKKHCSSPRITILSLLCLI